jgi:AmiR/NasT family two-component response regulator
MTLLRTLPPSEFSSSVRSAAGDVLTEQLQTALNSRVLIEQAKGVLAERLNLGMDQAFTLIRDTARSHNRRLSELAQAIVDGSEQIPSLVRPPR